MRDLLTSHGFLGDFGLLFTLIGVALDFRHGMSYRPTWLLFAVSDACWAAQFALEGYSSIAGLFAAVSLMCLWYWWRGRKKDRRKLRDVAGAKSRAIRDALVRKTREALRNRPLRSPLPQPV